MSKREIALYFGILVLVFFVLQAHPELTANVYFLASEKLGFAPSGLVFDLVEAAVISAAITATVAYVVRINVKERGMNNSKPNDMMSFFSTAKSKYASLGLQQEAAHCDEAIALVSRIYLDPRLDSKEIKQAKN
jgi:hypothetical protein